MFIVAMVLQGFGSVPLYVLGITYLDDASEPGTASVHIGIYSYSSLLSRIIYYTFYSTDKEDEFSRV